MIVAIAMHQLRDVRQSRIDAARRLVESRRYTDALRVLDTIPGRPFFANSSRVDYVAAEAYAGLCDRARAERHYLRAREADPGYFWALADLTVLYASADLPIPERRRQVAPYVGLLETTFSRHPELASTLARITRKLQQSTVDACR